jgi:uncharacterized protein (TIGR03437 family)
MRTCSFLLTAILIAAYPASGQLVPATVEVPGSMRQGAFSTTRTLMIPVGFKIAVIARIGSARFLAAAPNGDILVSQPSSGKVLGIRRIKGQTAQTFTYASGMNAPHDMVFHAIGSVTYLYISESNQISRFIYNSGDMTAHDRQVIISGLPDASSPELKGAYAHGLKNIAIGPDHQLYVSIGSATNASPSDTTSSPVRAAIYQYNPDGSNPRLFAKGLRNAEGLDFLPGTNQLWVVVNNRDNLPNPANGQVVTSYVDNHPAELFTAVRQGGNYGWPFCNSNPDTSSNFFRMPFDRDMDNNRDGGVDCATMDQPSYGMQAHSAPLGLSFLQASLFPSRYRQGAVSGLHGSWNRSTPTGYKVQYFPWSSADALPSGQQEFVMGWLDEARGESWGRPVDAIPDLDGNLIISDDASGTVYQLSFAPAAVPSTHAAIAIAPGSLASVYGSGLSNAILTLRDSSGATFPLRSYFSQDSQINFYVPGNAAAGFGTLLRNGSELGLVDIAPVSPGLFAANGNGDGVVAATAIRAEQWFTSNVPVFNCASAGSCQAVPIALSDATPVYLTLYGTGWRGAKGEVRVQIGSVSIPIQYAGPQGGFEGLDQINVILPPSLKGVGDVEIFIVADGVPSNRLRIRIA